MKISPFKMHKIIFFSRKKNNQKICVPTLPKFSDPLPETQLNFYLALQYRKNIASNRYTSEVCG